MNSAHKSLLTKAHFIISFYVLVLGCGGGSRRRGGGGGGGGGVGCFRGRGGCGGGKLFLVLF